MKIISLDNNQLEYFRGFDPFEILEREDIKPSIRLGAVHEGGKGDIPAGLLLGMENERSLVILWLFVTEPFRRRGLAEGLLSAMFSIAKETGTGLVTAVFPEEYGRELVCGGELDRKFFALHGFVPIKKGYMTASLKDFEREITYSGPSLEAEGMALYDLFDGSDPEDYEASAIVPQDEEQEDFPEVIHKPWEIKEVKLEMFAELPALKKGRQPDDGNKDGISFGLAGELSLMEFRRLIDTCVRGEHTGWIENLDETPPEYFDMEVSSYFKKDGATGGALLIRSDRKEQSIRAELLYIFRDEDQKALLGLLRTSILAALDKYPPDTRVMLPFDECHRPFLKKLLEDAQDVTEP